MNFTTTIYNFPPSGNNRLMSVRGRMIKTGKYRSWQQATADMVREQIRKGPLEGRLRLTMRVHMPDRRRRDLDNLVKPIQDVLQLAGLYYDDSQIKHLDIREVGVDPIGGIEIEVAEDVESVC